MLATRLMLKTCSAAALSDSVPRKIGYSVSDFPISLVLVLRKQVHSVEWQHLIFMVIRRQVVAALAFWG